ncbi:MAG: hypothetical protein ACE5KJ_08700 [Candidatus Zixiibacteriota bacterium]
MNPISAEVVEKTWKRVAGTSLQEVPETIDRMTKEQPLILAYLLAVGHDIFNQDERELLFFLGMVIWQIMSQGTTRLPKITEKTIDEVEESNLKMLEYLEGESETGFVESVEGMLENYNQREVLGYVMEALMEEPEEGCLIREENKGLMMIYLKTVLDCFDR